MNFQHTGLDQRHDAIDRVDCDHMVAVLGDELEALAVEPGRSMLLKEALAAHPFWAAHQAERAIDHMGRDPIPHRDVVLG